MTDKKEIMDRILVGKDESGSADEKSKALDFLIYRSEADLKKEGSTARTHAQEAFKISKGNVTVEVWEGKAKIKVKMIPGKDPEISMKKIATIAVDAIIEALKKE